MKKTFNLYSLRIEYVLKLTHKMNNIVIVPQIIIDDSTVHLQPSLLHLLYCSMNDLLVCKASILFSAKFHVVV